MTEAGNKANHHKRAKQRSTMPTTSDLPAAAARAAKAAVVDVDDVDVEVPPIPPLPPINITDNDEGAKKPPAAAKKIRHAATVNNSQQENNMGTRSSGNKKTAPRAGTLKSTMSKTPVNVNNENNNSSSTGKRKGNYHDNFEYTEVRKQQKLAKDNKSQIAQIIIGLTEDPGLDTIKVYEHLCEDKMGVKWPVIIMSKASDILKKMKAINPSLKLDTYGGNKGKEGWKEGSDEAKLNAILRGLGFWTVKQTSLTKFEVKAPQGSDWKKAVCHPLLEADDYVDGTFVEEKVAMINATWAHNNKKPNPFEDNEESKKYEVKQASINWRGFTICLKRGLSEKEAEEHKDEAKKVCREMEGKNPAVKLEEIEEALKVKGLKSRRQQPGWDPETKITAPKKRPSTKTIVHGQEKKDQTKALMGWQTWPTGLFQDRKRWVLRKMVNKICCCWYFSDTKEGLLDAVKVKARFDEMKTSKKNLLEAAVTAEEKDELKEVITMHCAVVKEGESCVCAWCKDSNSGKKVSSDQDRKNKEPMIHAV